MKMIFLAAALLTLTPLAHAKRAEIWGGEHIELSVHHGRATFDFDCASAVVESGFDIAKGTIEADGIYQPMTGVEPPPGLEPAPEAAHFSAVVTKGKMQLTIELKSGKQSYVLTHGEHGLIHRCL